MADHRTDYYRACNALDLVEWLFNQTNDPVTLVKYVERLRNTLALAEQRLKEDTQ